MSLPAFLEPLKPAIEFHDKVSSSRGWYKYPFQCRKFMGHMLQFGEVTLKKVELIKDFGPEWTGQFTYKGAIFHSDDGTYVNEHGETKELTLEILYEMLQKIPLEIIEAYLRYDLPQSINVRKITDKDIDIQLIFGDTHTIRVPIDHALARCQLIRDMFCEFKSINEIQIPISCSAKMAYAFIDIISEGRIVPGWLPADSNELPIFWSILDFLGISL